MMRVEFQKTGARRYGVNIYREGFPDLVMNPAPGFDSLMPHDLLHFLVEEALGLKKGIFGQIAHGGTAGTFHHKPAAAANARAAARQRRKDWKRGEKLLKTGLDDCAQSERATYFCLYDWLSQSADDTLRARAEEMKIGFENLCAQIPENERAALGNEKRARIRARMDELSERWAELKIGEALALEWTL